MSEQSKMIFQYILPAIIGSSVLTAIVNQFFSSLANKKNDNLENITKERDLWRKKLREIVKRLSILEDFQRKDIRLCLDEIKTSINPYGEESWKGRYKNYTGEWVKNDGFVWVNIEKIEKGLNFNDYTNWDEDKNNLIYSISLLLKLDWERSKREIKGNYLRKTSFFLIIVYELLMCLFLKKMLFFIYDNPGKGNIILILNVVIILALPILVRQALFNTSFKPISTFFTVSFLVVLVPFLTFFTPFYFSIANFSYELGAILYVIYFLIVALTASEVGTDYGKMASYFEEIKEREREEKEKNVFFSSKRLLSISLFLSLLIFLIPSNWWIKLFILIISVILYVFYKKVEAT